MVDVESPGVDFSTAATSPLLLLPLLLPAAAAAPLLAEEEDEEEAAAVDIAVAVKKKRRPYRHKKFGCTVAEQIMKAVAATRERRGLSVAAVKKLLSASGYNLARNNSRVNQAVRTLVSKGSLVQTTGSGASGSVRLGRSGPQETMAAAAKVPSGATARRTVVSAARRKPPAAKKSRRRLTARRGGGRKRHSRLKKAAGRRHKAGGGPLRKVNRWKTIRVMKRATKGRISRRRAKAEAKIAPESVKPTDLVDEKATLSQNTEPNKG
ncbi:uncharacterized protein LOC144602844 [Rhinoraja longicauda]